MLVKIIQATVSSLGCIDNGIYSPEPDCLASIHDLIRHLHNDNETLDARRICLVHNIVRNDLVPIMISDDTDNDLFNLALRLTMNLCQPTIMAFSNKMPETEEGIQAYYDCEANLVNTLNGFTKKSIFDKFGVILKNFFSKEWTDRAESDKIIIDRIVVLLRYIFSIGMECPVTAEMSKIDPLIKERVVRAFLSTELPTILMTVACDKMEKELSIHIMATFSLLLRTIECERVATFQQIMSAEILKAEEKELQEIAERDLSVIKAKRAYLLTNRSHLGATYVMKNAALRHKDLLVSRTATTPLDNLRTRKQTTYGTKRNRVHNVVETVFKSNSNAPLDICQLLNAFTKELIMRAFDKMMKTTRETAFNNARAGGVLAYSDINYFFLAEYVFQFIRLASMPIDKIASVFSRDFFHNINSQSDNYFELMKTDKANIMFYSLRAQHAITAYKEMMLLLYSLSKSENTIDKEAFSYLTEAIFYDEEYREFGYSTLFKLQPQGMTRKLLDDLIVACHYYILTMDHIIKAGELQIVAKRKRIAKQRKKKAKQMIKDAQERAKTDKMNGEELEELWKELVSDIGDVLEGKVQANDDISPINTLLKVSDEQHQIFAALQIQRALRGRRVCDAVGLLKAARDVWPDTTFGDYSSTSEQDNLTLKDIYGMDLIDIAVYYDEQMNIAYGIDASEEKHVSVSDNESEVNDSENEEKPKYKIAEINFDFKDYIRNFTKPEIIKWYIFALKDFDSNHVELNRAILKMFYRIGFQLNMPSHLYQASLFRIFSRVSMEIQKWPKETAKKHKFYDIYKLGHHLLQKFFGHFKERGEVIFCELLFLKSQKECTDIELGYGTYEERQNDEKIVWTEELEHELQSLYNEYNSLDEKPEGISLIDFIQHNLSKERYPKQIHRQLKCLGLPVEKLKRQRKPKKEGDNKQKSKKIIQEDQLFASRSPSPQKSGVSSEEESDMESTSTPNLIENEDGTNKEQIGPTKPEKKKAYSSYRQSLRQPVKEIDAIEDDGPDENSKPASELHIQQSFPRRIVESDESDNENLELVDSNQTNMLTNTSKRFIESDEEDEIVHSSQRKRQKIMDDED